MPKKSSRFRNRTPRFAGGSRVEREARDAAAQAATEADLAQQYHYVIEDLSRVGIIAALLIGAMVVLKLFVIK